jgi:hypothetical protein
MMLFRIRRTAAWAGLCGAMALAAPAGTASAAGFGQPVPLTVTPQLALSQAPASGAPASSSGLVQLAQTDAQLRRRRQANRRQFQRQRAASRRQFQRERQASRRQFQRQRQASRRQFQRQRAADRRYARPNRIWRNDRWYYWDNGRYVDNTGAAIAAGIIGLAAGAIAAQALNDNRTVVVEDYDYVDGVPAPYTAEWYRQCDLKYRSFRASDGTFLGYDGVRHVCRLP